MHTDLDSPALPPSDAVLYTTALQLTATYLRFVASYCRLVRLATVSPDTLAAMQRPLMRIRDLLDALRPLIPNPAYHSLNAQLTAALLRVPISEDDPNDD